MDKLTHNDKNWLRMCALAMDADADGPEVVMVSIGYVDLWSDGQVQSHGVTIWTVEF